MKAYELDDLVRRSELFQSMRGEVERLQAKSEKDKNTLLVSLEAALQDIERLKLELHQEKQYAAEQVTTLQIEIEEKAELLVQCAEALSHYALLNDFEKSLIGRIREATTK